MNLELHTRRLFLRPYHPFDVDLDIEMATDPDVMRHFGGVVTEEEITAEAANFTRRCGGGCIGVWTIVDRTTEHKLGEVYLTPLPIDVEDTQWDLIQGDDFPDEEIEIGNLLRRSAWGRGVATEACQRLLRFVFEESPLTEIVGVIEPENPASEKVLLKCGFLAEGMRRACTSELSAFRITKEHWSGLEQQSA